MIRKKTIFFAIPESFSRSISILLVCLFCVTMLTNSFSSSNNVKVHIEIDETSNETAGQPISDTETQKKEAKEEFILTKKSLISVLHPIKSYNSVSQKLLFENRISDLITPPPKFS